ncbi:(2Fe-2S)-binding protein [Oceanobacillus sp. J11TS1]|uniref:(2Fe-2S)-binding protein n=1 Tax=Oceanobacillus sp. J11TS1 TaxID=2807191 RepID=UPI001AFD5358|nr:(2Fe-2S)-binding protein [Oceanobacillus sp. J11TS1]GIO23800.1 hypothetical protein J11TS1_23810 [Oceanobacillus sp. J11TS1]
MDKSTIVCRCEEINIDEIETAIKNGAETFDDIKRLTRCGMGPCQSKTCFYPVNEIIAEYTGMPLNEVSLPRLRMPLKMVRMSTLAQDSEGSNVVSVFGESVEDGES